MLWVVSATTVKLITGKALSPSREILFDLSYIRGSTHDSFVREWFWPELLLNWVAIVL